jgi:hypothetical protein
MSAEQVSAAAASAKGRAKKAIGGVHLLAEAGLP